MPDAPLSWDEAVARVTGPDGRYPLVDATIDGRTYKVFANTPPSLRFLFELASGHGDQDYLVYEDERLTFADVWAQVDAMGALLLDRYGVRHGDRVAIAMRNYPEWIVAFQAITSIGAVAVALNAWWTTDELDYGFEDCGAKVALADQERAERLAPVRESLGLSVIGVRLTDDLRRRRPAGGRARPVGPAARGRHRPRRRRHHPLHLGHHRPPEGRGVDPPGRAQRPARLRRPLRGQRPHGAGRRRRTRPGTAPPSSSSCRSSTSPAACRSCSAPRRPGPSW